MPQPDQPRTPKQKVWIDCTHTVNGRFHTGVQRVVRLLCSEAAKIDDSVNFSFRPVILEQGRFCLAAMNGSDPATLRLSNHPLRWRDDIVSHLPEFYRVTASALCDRLQVPMLRRWLLPLPGHLGAFRAPVRISQAFDRNAPADPAPMVANDVLLLPDSYWSKHTDWDAIKSAKTAGLKLIFVLYDLIPHTHAEHYDQEEVRNFRSYLSHISELADGVIAISETVARQFRDYTNQQSSYSGNKFSISSFALGAQIVPRDGFVRRAISTLFDASQNKTPYLMVGSIEIRKNHHYALDALEQVWKTHPDVKLLVIGRCGWQGKSVVQRMQNNPRFGKQLFMLHDVTDSELNMCYANARGILFPSLTEGFGLPIVESLWHGCQPFVSDIAIHHEVGGDANLYCDLSDPGSLAALISQWEQQWGASRPQIERKTQVLTWQQSFRQLCDRIDETQTKIIQPATTT